MITVYWLICLPFGIAGMLGFFEYSPGWLIIEVSGLLFIVARIISGKTTINDYMTPVGISFAAWILYANLYYLIYSFLNFTPGFIFEKSVIDQGFFISFTSVCTFALLMEGIIAYGKPRISPVRFFDSVSTNQQPFPILSVFFIGLIIAAYVATVLSSGAFFMIGKVSRVALADATETGKVWLLYYFLTGASIYYLYALSATTASRIEHHRVLGCMLAAFWVLYLMLGNRRGILTVVVAGVIIFGWKRTIRLKHALVGTAMLLLLMSVGVVRQLGGTAGGMNTTLMIIDGIGEFYFPHITLLETIKNSSDTLLGTSLFTWLPNFVQAKLSGDSFSFLAQQFAYDVAPAGAQSYMGYAYMPLTEMYKNFGIAGAFIAPILIVAAFWILEQLFGKKSFPVVSIGAMAVDINRGDFGSITLQYIIILCSGLMLMGIARISNISLLKCGKQ